MEKSEANEGEKEAEVIPGYSSFESYTKEGFNTLKMGIKMGNNLPSGENFKYYSCFPSFNKFRTDNVDRLSKLMQKIVEINDIAGSMKERNMEEKFELLIETNDVLLDKANACMDEETGVAKKTLDELEAVAKMNKKVNKRNYGSWNSSKSLATTDKDNNSQMMKLLASKNIQRPQVLFKDKIDNSTDPWEPRIKDKPNSLKPLGIYLIDSENGQIFCHPYEFELDKFVPPDSQLEKKVPVKYKSLEDTPLIFIERLDDLNIMLEDLKKYNEIGIDLEHHSYRTFQGITCLMQISTRDTDYIIDTLLLRSELHVLNSIFTNPAILKVFHGAESDILWLQRDLSLYIVNMFDTHQAAKQLNLPYLSLSYLLKAHCNVDPNKHFQLADWRIRPLPEELMKYAREDTHYLLYIKDVLNNSLIDIANGQTNILKAVYDRSTEVCKLIYEKPIFTENSYMNLYRKSQKMFNNRQLYALKELYFWRDLTARIEDDSIVYVLPNHMLLNIAETLPREMQGILACCNPIPPLVRQNLLKLHKIIIKAREQPLIKPVIEQDIRQRLTQRNQAIGSDSFTWSSHDIPHGNEFQDNLPCLLDKDNNQQVVLNNTQVNHKHSITVFDSPPNSDDDEESNLIQSRLEKVRKLFISPFERYKRVIPMIAAQEEKERTEKNQKVKQENAESSEKDKETEESINRVHQHFLHVSKEAEIIASNKQKSKAKKRKVVPLSQVPGTKKRKHGSNLNTPNDDSDVEVINDTTTPKPKKDTTVVHLYKKLKKQENDNDDYGSDKNVSNGKLNGNAPLSMAFNRQKGQKKKNLMELEKQGMLPSKSFNYSEVDFSSFQGGSKGNNSKVCHLQQKPPKHKRKRQRGKKKN